MKLTEEQRNAIEFAYQILMERGTEGGWKYAAILSSILAAPSDAAQAPQPDERAAFEPPMRMPGEKFSDWAARAYAADAAPQPTAKGGER